MNIIHGEFEVNGITLTRWTYGKHDTVFRWDFRERNSFAYAFGDWLVLNCVFVQNTGIPLKENQITEIVKFIEMYERINS